MRDAGQDMSDSRSDEEKAKARDMGGRRRKSDRRSRTTAGTFPEQRWLRHRRNGSDRRSWAFFNPLKDGERREVLKNNGAGEEKQN